MKISKGPIYFFFGVKGKIIMGRSGLGSETNFVLLELVLYALSFPHFNFSVVPKGQDRCTKKNEARGGELMLFLDHVCFSTGFLPNRARCGAWVGWGFFSRRLRASGRGIFSF